MAEFEEFEESEVIFSEDGDGNVNVVEGEFEIQEIFHVASKRGRLSKPSKKKKISATNSVPVNIPDSSVFRFHDKDELVRGNWTDDDDDDGEVVPPHVIVGRRISGCKMAYSVCTGNGRTLKGRDLSRVRNSILRLTGFLET